MKYSNIYTFRVIIEPDEPKGYHGFVPILKGLHTCGETIEEVKKNLREAIKCHIQGQEPGRKSDFQKLLSMSSPAAGNRQPFVLNFEPARKSDFQKLPKTKV